VKKKEDKFQSRIAQAVVEVVETADQIMSLLSAMLSMDSLEMEALSVLVDV
jgi:hypothetical protein